MSIKVLMADDHILTRAGFKTILSHYAPDVDVIGAAASGAEFLAQAARTRANVYILDIFMPDINGLEVAARLLATDKTAKIIILSMDGTRSLVEQAFRIGVKGYVLKENSADELVRAIYEVNKGNAYVSQEISGTLARALARPDGGIAENLTPRETDVLKMIAAGLTGKEIAVRLNVSPNTVHTHKASIMSKLGLHKQTELVAYAIKNKMA